MPRLFVPAISPEDETDLIECISHDFSFRLSVWIGDANLREVVRRNATPEYKGCCALHDFCDANMAMLESMQAWGIDFTARGEMSEEFIRICDAAWDQANLYNFDV